MDTSRPALEAGAEADHGAEADRGHAPGRLRLVEELIDTVELDSGDDELATATSTRAWLRGRGLLRPGERVDDEGRRALVEVREALRDLTAANSGERVRRDTLATLERHAADGLLSVQVGDHTTELVGAGPGVRGAIGTLLGVVHDAMVDGTWSRLKTCRDETCRWAYYDHSRNRSATWCSMAACGNRAKARAFRARHHPSTS
ncbi:MAG TPA: CGNR zinc finger domain-containing protein [Acidimicrobiia bacterium]|jgi:predicted RNA-binding Zn ribbon-like protein